MTEEPDRFLEPWTFPASFHEDEHVLSLVVRMSAQGAMLLKQFIQLYLDSTASTAMQLLYEKDALERLAIISGHPVEAIMRNAFIDAGGPRRRKLIKTIDFRGHVFPKEYLNQMRAVAPGMLKADGPAPYIRALWGLTLFPCDLDTGECLISICPFCDARLSWDVEDICICQECKMDLREHPPAYWPDRDMDNIRSVAGLMGFHGDRKGQPLDWPEPFDLMTADQQVQALRWCAGLRSTLEGSGLRSTVRNAYTGFSVIREWPDAVEGLARMLVRQVGPAYFVRDVMARLLNRDLPDFMREMVLDAIRVACHNATQKVQPPSLVDWTHYVELTSEEIAQGVACGALSENDDSQ